MQVIRFEVQQMLPILRQDRFGDEGQEQVVPFGVFPMRGLRKAAHPRRRILAQTRRTFLPRRFLGFVSPEEGIAEQSGGEQQQQHYASANAAASSPSSPQHFQQL